MDNLNIIKTDILIIGSGLAGVRAAQASARAGANVLLVGKGMAASVEVMGFNAVVESGDSPDIYYHDLRESGKWINDPRIVNLLAQNAFKEIPYLEELGMYFDKKEDGGYNALQTLGCRYPRLVGHKGVTGLEAIKFLMRDALRCGVAVRGRLMVVELLKENGCICGAVAVDTLNGKLHLIICMAVVLASGGGGNIYGLSTYPKGLVGDGYALAYRAGAQLQDMEFQQYEPCCFVYPKSLQGKLVPTTLLRAGARLTNKDGHEFMADYGLTKDNAQKGELSRAIALEILAGRGTAHGGIYYDMTMLPESMLKEEHSIFYDPALAAGIDLTAAPVEMAPAAHTFLGGVKIGEKAQASVPGLFAAGEVIGGLHGANRLGGCAGAETLVFGSVAGRSAAEWIRETSFSVDENKLAERCRALEAGTYCHISKKTRSPVSLFTASLGKIMMEKVGIIRSGQSLREANMELDRLEKIVPELSVTGPGAFSHLFEFENMLTVARMQVLASLVRTESRGVFFRQDYPEQDDKCWLKNIIISRGEAGMELTVAPAPMEEEKGGRAQP